MMRRAFTLLEVIIAAVILGVGLSAILLSISQAQRMMLASVGYEAVQEALDIGEMAYPLADIKDVDDIDVPETRVTELWQKISEERLSREQEDKFHGFTWERECLDRNASDDDVNRLGGIYRVMTTVRWGDRRTGHGERETSISLWRKPQ